MDVSVWLPILAVFIIFSAIFLAVSLPGRVLHKKFQALGDLTGMSKDQVFKSLGRYQSVHSSPHGKVYVWMATDYRISIVFDDGNKVAQVLTSDKRKQHPDLQKGLRTAH